MELTGGGVHLCAQVKDVCHIWELGSGTTFVSLLPVAFKTKQNQLISAVLVLDLSAPETILNTVETLLETTKATVFEYVKEKPGSRLNTGIEVRFCLIWRE